MIQNGPLLCRIFLRSAMTDIAEFEIFGVLNKSSGSCRQLGSRKLLTPRPSNRIGRWLKPPGLISIPAHDLDATQKQPD